MTDAEKALMFDLDKAGIEQRHKEAVELVELRAALAEQKRHHEEYRAKARAWINYAEACMAKADGLLRYALTFYYGETIDWRKTTATMWGFEDMRRWILDREAALKAEERGEAVGVETRQERAERLESKADREGEGRLGRERCHKCSHEKGALPMLNIGPGWKEIYRCPCPCHGEKQ